MAIKAAMAFQLIDPANRANRTPGATLRFTVDTYAEMPSGDLIEGDKAYCLSNGKRYIYTSGGWVLQTTDNLANTLQDLSGDVFPMADITDGQFLRLSGGTIAGLALPASALSGSYADLTNKPTLGTAAAQNTSAFEPSGAVASEASARASADSTLTTAVAAKASVSRIITTTAPLTGGGDLSADRTLGISAATSGAAGSMSAADFVKLSRVPFQTFTGTASKTVANTTVETSVIPTGKGTLLVPSAALVEGMSLHFWAAGSFSTGALGTLSVRVKFGSILTSSLISLVLPLNLGTGRWRAWGDGTVRNGSVLATDCFFDYSDTTGLLVSEAFTSGVSALTPGLDYTGDMTVQWSAASASNSFTVSQMFFQAVPPPA